MSNITLNDSAWEKIFDKYSIIDCIHKNGFFEITSEQINEFREARLMTKFDHKSNLPKLFQENKLTILPLTRGSYVIGPFAAYHKIEQLNNDIIKISFPSHIQSIDYENITSEAAAINTAFVAGILADFIEDDTILPTVSGRMSSTEFNFNIKNVINNRYVPLKIVNSQIEIDGGYEGKSALTLLEAKNSISDDFLIRQLYYPYRLWKSKLRKDVRPVFLIYSNGVFSLFEYAFEDTYFYNSLKLVKQKNYTIEPERIKFEEIYRIFRSVSIVPEPEIPFPQADSFKRIINLCELLYENQILTNDEITSNYDFDARQTNYYTDACRYLGLVDKRRAEGAVNYFLSDRGRGLFKLSIKERNLKLTEWILEHKPFYLTFKRFLELVKMPNKTEVTEIMKKSALYNVRSEETYKRRASTIVGWLNWIMDLQRL